MFSYITQNWRGKPLLTHQVTIKLIAATTTGNGLAVACALDASHYPKGCKVSTTQFDALNIRYNSFHPDWNYTIHPNRVVRAKPA